MERIRGIIDLFSKQNQQHLLILVEDVGQEDVKKREKPKVTLEFYVLATIIYQDG
jgi:hypothetical protein